MTQIELNTKFFPFIVNFGFLHNIQKKFIAEYEQRINLSEEKHISKAAFRIPLSNKLSQQYKRDFVFVVNLSNKEFNCWATCDIDDKEVFEYIKNIVQ